MKFITQFRFGSDGVSPAGLNATKLQYGNIFENFSQISQLGIQGYPGTVFYLNGSDYPITLGETGIYEIDLQDRGFIHSINFIGNSAFEAYTKGSRLLIDIVYEGKAGS